MARSWKVGTAFGIGIYVHWTFLLLPAYVFLANLGAGPISFALLAVAMVATVFGCVVLHELGHALTARHFGIGTRSITLYPIGGVARLERMSERPGEELAIALAGPAVNVAIAAILYTLLALGGEAATLDGFWAFTQIGSLGAVLMVANLYLALFNLLPAFPMDGGRVLRALLTYRLGRVRATEWAAGLGVLMAAGFFLWAILSWHPLLMILALFIFVAGQQELAMVRFMASRRQEQSLDLLPINPSLLQEPVVPVEAGFSGFTWDARARLWIEWRNGQPIHFISMP